MGHLIYRSESRKDKKMALKKHQTKTSIFEELDFIFGETGLRASSGV
jgi:hypothetical protein